MPAITVGELLLRCLQAEGVEVITGIIDGAHIPIGGELAHYVRSHQGGHSVHSPRCGSHTYMNAGARPARAPKSKLIKFTSGRPELAFE